LVWIEAKFWDPSQFFGHAVTFLANGWAKRRRRKAAPNIWLALVW
jgi:hypothetical protein